MAKRSMPAPGKEGAESPRDISAKKGNKQVEKDSKDKKSPASAPTKQTKPAGVKSVNQKKPNKGKTAVVDPKGTTPAKAPNQEKPKANKATPVPATFSAVLADKDMLSGSFVSLDEAQRIASIDLKDAKLSTDKKYPEKNRWQYYVGINLWLHIVYDQHPQDNVICMRRLRDYIRIHGLIATVRAGKADAAALLRSQEPTHLTFILGGLTLQQQLQALRFLKRFTPLSTDLLYKEAIENWLRVERMTRGHNMRNYILNTRYDYVMQRAKVYLADWLKRYKPVSLYVRDHVGPIPTGATYEKHEKGGSLSYCERIHQISSALKEKDGQSVFRSWLPDSSGQALVELPPIITEDLWPLRRTPQRYIKRYNRLVCVPKTADAPRIVCPESPINQYMQRAIRDDLEDSVPKWVRDHLPCHDQLIMEQAACRGFKDNLTTTDASHASDSVCLRHILDAFPAVVARDLKDWRPTHTILPDGSTHELQQLATMGAGFTWYVMALFFLALMCVACDLEGVPQSRKNQCFAFGDDLIHPTEITDTLYWILGMLGFVINEDKSFGGDSLYRESCGSEWWNANGTPISVRTLYYPRFPIKCRADGPVLDLCSWQYEPSTGQSVLTDTMSRFVALQHALYYEFPTASDFLTSVIITMEPKMTTSLAGSVCSDLWGPFEQPVIKDCKWLGNAELTWYDPTMLKDTKCTVRAGHLTPVVTGTKLPDDALLQEWRYREFLKRGPSPASDPLMSFLGMTEASPLTDPLTMTIKWVVKF